MKRFSWSALSACGVAWLAFPTDGFGQGFGFSPSTPPEPRAAVLKKYDQDADGRLTDAEREAMRKARFAERLQGARSGRGGFRFQWPPEVVKKYDKDKDGKLDDTENLEAMEGVRKQMEEVTKEFDKDGNGQLEEAELDAVRAAIDSGKIEGLPRMFFFQQGRRGGGPRGGNPWGGPPENPRDEILRKADKDQDGKLNEEELRAAREALGKASPRGARRTGGEN